MVSGNEIVGLGAAEPPAVVGRNWNDGSDRVASLIDPSRRNWHVRSLLQKPGALICMEPLPSKSNIHMPLDQSR